MTAAERVGAPDDDRRQARRATTTAPQTGPSTIGLARRWVRLITKWPIVTLIVIAVLGALTYPAKDLRIALPDLGTPTLAFVRGSRMT